jgi:small-conductance mechanosensitive channel
MLVLVGLLATMAILAHLSNIPEPTRNALDRVLALFALFLLLAMIPLIRANRFFFRLLIDLSAGRSCLILLQITTFLLSPSLFTIAILGIVGYLNLAWMLARYVGIFFSLLLAWLIVQDLLNYWSRLLKTRVSHATKLTVPLTQDVITLVHRILSIAVFLGVSFRLYRTFDWQAEYIVTNSEILVLAVVSVIISYEVMYFFAGQLIRSTTNIVARGLVEQSKKPMGLILPLTAAQMVIPKLPLAAERADMLLHLLTIAQIVAISWLVVRMVSIFDQYAEQQYYSGTKDRLVARRVRTQARVLRQIVMVIVYVIAAAAILMTFPTVRQLGAGLLASAGVAGLVVGIAARPLFENVIAGIQIGLTQPIRIDDHVIVEGEWGVIEAINSTYVVIHIWDDRRLIVPLNYFNTQPFENWTLTGSSLIGTVFLYVDYTFPVEALREKLPRILKGTDLWDGRVCVLQVTEGKEYTMELRALMTAVDAPTAWDLRCYAREKMIEFIQKHYPESLPKTRALLDEKDPSSGQKKHPINPPVGASLQSMDRSPAP